MLCCAVLFCVPSWLCRVCLCVGCLSCNCSSPHHPPPHPPSSCLSSIDQHRNLLTRSLVPRVLSQSPSLLLLPLFLLLLPSSPLHFQPHLEPVLRVVWYSSLLYLRFPSSIAGFSWLCPLVVFPLPGVVALSSHLRHLT